LQVIEQLLFPQVSIQDVLQLPLQSPVQLPEQLPEQVVGISSFSGVLAIIGIFINAIAPNIGNTFFAVDLKKSLLD
jgi:hypothetical protein